jgi:two-component system sensor histidine kinase DesK
VPRSRYAGVLRLEPFDAGEDPRAAPGAYRGEDAAPPWTLRRARQNMVWIYLAGLVFLVFAVGTLLEGRPRGAELAVRIAVVAAIALLYICTAWVCDLPLSVRWGYVLLFTLLLISSSVFMGWSFIYYGIYVAVMLSTLIPWRQSRVAVLVVGLTVMVIAVAIQEWAALSIGITGLFVGWASGAGMEAGRLSHKLDRSRQRVSVLAVAAERERIGRDLHDILGHSLTAISIKAGLAGKLIDHDAEAARAEMADIEVIARQALGDVRSTASGYREVRVPTEIASARSVLQAAGVAAQVPSAVEPLPDRVSELFGYVVREAVTNVVRHADATSCTIAVSADAVSVTDDGVGFTRSSTNPGSGLRGLSDRLTSAGGRLVVRSRPEGGTEVRAELDPRPGPSGAPVTSGQSSADASRPVAAP